MEDTPKKEPARRETCTVEVAAKRLGIGRNQAYEALRRGDFPVPVIKIGGVTKVPIWPLDKLLRGG